MDNQDDKIVNRLKTCLKNVDLGALGATFRRCHTELSHRTSSPLHHGGLEKD